MDAYYRSQHGFLSGSLTVPDQEATAADDQPMEGSLYVRNTDAFYSDNVNTYTVVDGNGNKVMEIYKDGVYIICGAARLVYARQDKNGNGTFETDEVYVFYTHNHYNDFREYLNYYGGWGQMFGNITGGGVFDSKTQCNPTPYPVTAYASFSSLLTNAA